ncbi:MAG: diguanylate cyclase [Desulfobulbaceae bacterium]|nr:diguanylate cyclase [Desulfobulbaceae bacterium]
MTTTPADSNPKQDQKKKRLLIVDDDPLIIELLGLFITTFGYEFESASDGVEALEKIAADTFSIVITDMIMPRMDGMQLLQKIKEQNLNISVIVVTGHTGTFSYTDVINAGASDFISKPFNSDELEAKINRIFREQKIVSELEYLSTRDPLTDLYNRRSFDEKLKEEAYRADRQGYPLFLALLDVDWFKEYNDTHGHQAGDEVLRCVGTLLRQNIRENVDSAFRFGGDEFAIILPQTGEEEAEMITKRVQENYSRLCARGTTSLSIGLARFARCPNQSREKDLLELVTRADKALYSAKDAGRNRIVIDKQ